MIMELIGEYFSFLWSFHHFVWLRLYETSSSPPQQGSTFSNNIRTKMYNEYLLLLRENSKKNIRKSLEIGAFLWSHSQQILTQDSLWIRVLVNLQRANTSAPAWNVIPQANSSWYQRDSVLTCSRRTRSCSWHCLNDSVWLFEGFCRTWSFTFFTPWGHRTLPWLLLRQKQVNGCSEKRNIWWNERRLKEHSEMLLKV